MVATVSLNIEGLAKRTKAKIGRLLVEGTQDVVETVVERTPVDTGLLRGSWFVSFDRAAVNTGAAEDPSGGATIARMSLTLSGTEVGRDIYVLNQAHYANYVENGTTRMAPRLFVASTVNDAPQIFAAAAARISKQ